MRNKLQTPMTKMQNGQANHQVSTIKHQASEKRKV